MKKGLGFFCAVLTALTFTLTASAGTPVLLNEVEVNPPVEVGDRCQYVELRGTGTIPANTWFVSINSDQSNFGFLNAAIDLSGQTFGMNGILVIKNSLAGTCPNRVYDPAASVLTYSNPLTLGKGSEGYYVVTTDASLLAGSDLDVNDDGVLDIGAPIRGGKDSKAGINDLGGTFFNFLDGFDLNYNPQEHFKYGPGPNLVQTFLGDVPDAATRFPDNTSPNSAAAWYSGNIASGPEETTAYGSPVSANFPAGGMLTPGAANAPSAGGSAPFDFDGDGRTDVSVFRANPSSFAPNPGPEGSTSQWWLLFSNDLSTLGVTFGLPSDVLTPGDFTGDGKSDISFFRPSTSEWFVIRSEDFSFFAFPFGQAGDVPAPGDFDGDGITDAAVYRPSIGTWFILRSSDQQVAAIQFGLPEDLPTVADFDGDGLDDIAQYRPSLNQWWQFRSTAGIIGYQFGAPGDRSVVGDYTGDGRADVAFYRPSTSEWFVLRSEDASFYAFPWGAAGDVPAPGDYDGDGVFDPAVYRPGDTTWYINRSTSGFLAVPFGVAADQPLPGTFSVQ